MTDELVVPDFIDRATVSNDALLSCRNPHELAVVRASRQPMRRYKVAAGQDLLDLKMPVGEDVDVHLNGLAYRLRVS